MRQYLLLAALSLMAAGAAVSLAWGTSRRLPRWVTYGAAACASALVAATGALCVAGAPVTVNLGDLLDFGQTTLRLDQLAGLFLTLSGSLGAVISLALANWPSARGGPGERATAPGYLLLLASVTVVVVAGDAFTFLFAWEALTVGFYILAAATRRRSDQPGAAWATAVVGKVGGAALLVGFLLLAGAAHSFELAAWAGVGQGALHSTAYALVVFGFGTKVGLVPFQVWMPRGYPAADGPARAAMAGLAVNAGFYGLWRFLGILGRPPEWLAATVLVLGGLTALLGIAFAAVQPQLSKVIAYSSAENGGIIMVGFGVALAGAFAANRSLIAVGLLAASLQVLAHAVAKTGLFLGAANFEAAAGSSDLGQISGMARAQPWGSAAFAAGALTLAGLPPTIGFASEWFTFEALMQQFRIHQLALRLATASAGALIALTAGVAALTFVRLLGFTVLGRPRQAGRTSTLGHGTLGHGTLGHGTLGHGTLGHGTLGHGETGRAGFVLLAVSCFGLAGAAPWVVRYIASGLSPVVARSVTIGALKSPWVLQPVFPNFSALSPSWLLVVMPIGFVAVTAATVAASRGRFLKVRRVPAWRSATPGVHGEDSYNAFAYVNPLRHVLSNVLGTQKESVVLTAPPPAGPGAGGPGADGPGADGPGAGGPGAGGPGADGPGAGGPEPDHAHVVVSTSVAEPVERYLYRPALAGFMAIVRTAKRLQCGRVDAYVGYMLAALVAVLIVAAVMA